MAENVATVGVTIQQDYGQYKGRHVAFLGKIITSEVYAEWQE